MPGDRTEQATPYRREKARKDGDILRSREISSAAGTLVGVLCLGFLGPRIVRDFRTVFKGALDLGSPQLWEASALQTTLREISHLAMMMMLSVGIVTSAIAGAAMLSGVLQTRGLQINMRAIEVQLDRINPVSNLTNLFSLHAVSRLGKSVIPAAILTIVAVQRITRELRTPALSTVRIQALGSDVYGLLTTTSWLLLAWALIDYVVEWRRRESRLMMSRDQMKQEFKETEGSPQTKSRIRGLLRQVRHHKLKMDVAKAAVVLTNPTHYAVALGFDFNSMEAPRVLAKGRNLLAEEIKAEARWAGIPIVENRPLAHSLYRGVEVGQAIPVDLYTAVAAILAYLYRQRAEAEMRERRARQDMTPTEASSYGRPQDARVQTPSVGPAQTGRAHPTGSGSQGDCR